MSESLVIVGAGGHGREVLQVARDAGFDVRGFIDDRQPDEQLLKRIDTEWLGTTASLAEHRGARYVIGIGTGQARKLVEERTVAAGLVPAVLVHPMASVGTDVSLGDGVVVFAFATVTTNISLGRHTHVGRGAAVGHDSTLGDYVTVYPLASVSGNVTLGPEVTVGTTASIKQGLSIGAGTTIGSGAAVVADLPPGVTAVGVPARVVREAES